MKVCPGFRIDHLSSSPIQQCRLCLFHGCHVVALWNTRAFLRKTGRHNNYGLRWLFCILVWWVAFLGFSCPFFVFQFLFSFSFLSIIIFTKRWRIPHKFGIIRARTHARRHTHTHTHINAHAHIHTPIKIINISKNLLSGVKLWCVLLGRKTLWHPLGPK